MLLADSVNPHTIKWATGLANRGYSIIIFSLFKSDKKIYKNYNNIELYNTDFNSKLYRTKEGSLKKIKFLFALPKLKNLIRKIIPEIREFMDNRDILIKEI